MKVISGIVFTSENHGILCYSPLHFNDYMMSEETYLAKIELKPDTSNIDILESSILNLDKQMKYLEGGINGDRFVIKSEQQFCSNNRSANFYIFHKNDINVPKKIIVDKINDKIEFYKLVGNYIYYLDTPQFGLFDEIFFKKSVIRRLDIETGTVTTIETSKFPDCDCYLVYGKVSSIL